MTLRVYNGEKFERNRRWYVLFALVLITIIGLSLWKQNVIGVVVLFFILGAYFYYSIVSNQIISLKIEKNHLIINNKIYLRGSFRAYSIEIEKKNQQIRNIVLITEKGYMIYTIHDKNDRIKEFLIEINDHLPLVSEYNQSSLEKLARILKL
ncbi:MAG: hypothetical protein PHR61_04990 [Candidatus Absconditabacteria bacterium]|nr:hypothetical protein [Candidatus Absconditabacteria bacterium]